MNQNGAMPPSALHEYHLNVDIPEGKSGEYSIEHVHEPEGAEFELATARTAMLGGDPGGTVKFDSPTRWHTLHRDGEGVWMKDIPIEQFQMRKHVKEFTGDVLIGGLGLGVVVNHLAARPEIDTITVIEVSQDVINLVEPYLRDPEGKVTVVQADLFEWLAQVEGRECDVFDHAFFDIWQTDGEDTFLKTVVPLRKLAIENEVVMHDACIECWQETLMRMQLYYSLVARLHNVSFAAQGDNPTLERLKIEPDLYAHPQGNMYWDWSCAFFKWLNEKKRTEELTQRRMQEYAGTYGLSNGEDMWAQIIRDD
jgi:hypothetical protein